jgi:Fe-S-cluster containining protein
MLKSEEDFKFSHLPNHPVYVGKFFELFACQRCGVCCNSFGGVPVSEQEVIRISADLKIDADIFRGKYTVTAGNIMSLKQPCPFSTKEGCQIYEDRPEN